MKDFEVIFYLKKQPLFAYLSGLPIIFYASGFLIWNSYLYTLGFIDDSFLQARFILTGILFCIASILLLSVLIFLGATAQVCFSRLWGLYLKAGFCSNLVAKLVSFSRISIYDLPKEHEVKIAVSIVLVTLFFLLWVVSYSSLIFPFIPQLLGGGQPRAISFVVENRGREILGSFGIPLGEGAKFQTPPTLCIAHENDSLIYMLLWDRILAVDKTLLTGYVSLPGPNQQNEQVCIRRASEWSYKGLVFSGLLLRTELENRFLKIFKFPYRKRLIAN